MVFDGITFFCHERSYQSLFSLLTGSQYCGLRMANNILQKNCNLHQPSGKSQRKVQDRFKWIILDCENRTHKGCDWRGLFMLNVWFKWKQMSCWWNAWKTIWLCLYTSSGTLLQCQQRSLEENCVVWGWKIYILNEQIWVARLDWPLLTQAFNSCFRLWICPPCFSIWKCITEVKHDLFADCLPLGPHWEYTL